MPRTRVVKVRVTEAEYADWTQQALGASVSLSEAIRRAMGAGSHPDEVRAEKRSEAQALIRAFADFPRPNRSKWSPVNPVDRDDPPRRTETCPHGKPGFAYCPECDR